MISSRSGSISTITSDASKHGPVSRRPTPDRPGDRSESPAWLGTAVGYIVLTVLAAYFEGFGHIVTHPLLCLFFGLALLAALLPAAGPRGQRVTMLPGIGFASALLLAPLTATLPLLLTNALNAACTETSAERRLILGRGAWLGCAILVTGLPLRLVPHVSASGTLALECVGAALYTGVYVLGRRSVMHFTRPFGGLLPSRAWTSGRQELAGLLACLPAAILMKSAYATLGVGGVAAMAGLMGLLLVIAAFGFEVGLLREQVRAMEKISAITLTQTNPSKVIERFLHLSTGLVPCDRASLWLTDVSETKLERVAHRQFSAREGGANRTAELSAGEVTKAVRFGEGVVGRVAGRQVPLIVREEASQSLSPSEKRGSGSAQVLLLVPLIAGGDTVGVVQFERDMPGHYSRKDLMRVRSLASQVAAMIANMRMHRDVYTQAVTDGLTGLYNRRHMQAALFDERQRSARYAHPLSVIMLDVDGFKSYNDTYGHPQGDVLLKMLAGLLRENVREVDIVGRYGGEEFIILMPETSKEEAVRTAERLRSAVATSVFPGFADDPDMVVFKTISLGVATCPDDTDDVQSLVSVADQALYRAKRGGRNQVVLAGS